MKNSIYTTCAYFLLSVVSLSCLDHRDPVDPAGKSCQIVQETIKSRTSPIGLPVEETILLDETNAGSPLPVLLPNGNTLNLATIGTNTYRYNAQGQLIEEIMASVDNPPNSNPYVTTYEYTEFTLKLTRLGFKDANGNTQIDNYTLNDEGLIATGNSFGGQQTYAYDTNGYLIQVIDISSSGDTTKRLYTIENGNVVKVVSSGLNFIQTITYSYDLTKLNLPNTRTILIGQNFADSEVEANQSRNLPTKRVDEINATQQTDSGSGIIKLINTKYYTYTFDSQNRVKRKLQVHTYRSSIFGSPLPTPGFVDAFTTDYAYSCPI